MRSRNIKPGFAKNEDLAECSFPARLCFAMLPMMADREGRLEDRPKRIKGELFPFDSVEVEPLLEELERRGFIARYASNGLGLIQILAFRKHQNPHHREPESDLPPHPSLGLDVDGKYIKPQALPACNEVEASGKAEALPSSQGPPASGKAGNPEARSDLPRGSNPADSGFLIPDSGSPLPPRKVGRKVSEFPPGFEAFWRAYPRKDAKAEAAKAFARLKVDEALFETLLKSLSRQKNSPHWTKDGGAFIPYAATWLNGRRWEDEGPSVDASETPWAEAL